MAERFKEKKDKNLPSVGPG